MKQTAHQRFGEYTDEEISVSEIKEASYVYRILSCNEYGCSEPSEGLVIDYEKYMSFLPPPVQKQPVAIPNERLTTPEAKISNRKYSEGFQNLKWGDSPQKVRAQYPGGKLGKDGNWSIKRQANGSMAIIDFNFYRDKLFQVVISYPEIGPAMYGKFRLLAKDLDEKYGHGQGAEFKEIDDFDYTWTTDESIIELSITSEDHPKMLTLEYNCIDLLQEWDENQKNNVQEE